MTVATARGEIDRANRGEGCLGKAAPDEPVFTLRAQDMFAADLVERWAILASERLGKSHPKVEHAFEMAKAMRAWPTQKYPD